jgi:hypothetical protein
MSETKFNDIVSNYNHIAQNGRMTSEK